MRGPYRRGVVHLLHCATGNCRRPCSWVRRSGQGPGAPASRERHCDRLSTDRRARPPRRNVAKASSSRRGEGSHRGRAVELEVPLRVLPAPAGPDRCQSQPGAGSRSDLTTEGNHDGRLRLELGAPTRPALRGSLCGRDGAQPFRNGSLGRTLAAPNEPACCSLLPGARFVGRQLPGLFRHNRPQSNLGPLLGGSRDDHSVVSEPPRDARDRAPRGGCVCEYGKGDRSAGMGAVEPTDDVRDVRRRHRLRRGPWRRKATTLALRPLPGSPGGPKRNRSPSSARSPRTGPWLRWVHSLLAHGAASSRRAGGLAARRQTGALWAAVGSRPGWRPSSSRTPGPMRSSTSPSG